jgi:hypothetical protein
MVTGSLKDGRMLQGIFGNLIGESHETPELFGPTARRDRRDDKVRVELP